jgi:hypothetical protein
MTPIVASGLLSLGSKLIDHLLPDPKAAAEAKLKLLELEQNGDLAILSADTQIAVQQGKVNEVEAASESFFVKGWRPAVGWVCVAAFAAKYIGGPFLFVLAQFTDHSIVLPPIDMTEMLPILVGMLGLGGYRTWEKIKRS